MKKFLVILVVLIGFGINSFASDTKTCSVKFNNETIGYVTAWYDIEEKGIMVSNDTNKRVTVTVTYEGTQTKTVSVDAGKTVKAVSSPNKMLNVISVTNPICQ